MAAPSWIGPLLGGSVLASISSIGTYTVEKKPPTTKSIARDFILGAILFGMIAQLLPESTTAFVAAIIALIPSLGPVESIPAVTDVIESVGTSYSDSIATVHTKLEDEIEVKVGVPRF